MGWPLSTVADSVDLSLDFEDAILCILPRCLLLLALLIKWIVGHVCRPENQVRGKQGLAIEPVVRLLC